MIKFITSSVILIVYLFLFTSSKSDILSNNNPINIKLDSLPYLGQNPPDTIPIRFGPSYLITNGSWGWHGSPKFSPDGKEMFFVKYHFNLPSGNAKMYFMKDVNGVWTMPAQPSFASDSIDNSPVYSPDGNRLYFSSYRTGAMRYYFVTRTGNSWSQPTMLNMTYQSMPGSPGWDFAMTQDSTIYFSLYTQANGADLYLSRINNGQYSTFERLPNQINTASNEISPYISPDEKYIMFGSNRTGSYGLHDVYISFKKTDGTWTQAQNMGNRINGTSEDSFPWVTPDGKYMFFNSAKTGDLAYNAYWVDSKVIDRFKPVGIIKTGENVPDGFRLEQNYPNPFNPRTVIRCQLPVVSNVLLIVYDVQGREVQTLVNDRLQAGTYEVTFDGSMLNSGVYFYKLISGKFTETKSMVLTK